MRNERGVTLVEVLAVLALSSIVLIGVYSFTSSMLKADERASTATDIRNEVILITEQLNQFFINTDRVMISSDKPLQFKVVKQKSTIDETGKVKQTNAEAEFKYQNKTIYIDGKRINSDSYQITEPELMNQNQNSHLRFTVQHQEKTDVTKDVNLIYSTGGGS
ncbi:prepilin-type N-terminal cleavage/methylation domain-containing protein [Virgibacillus sp. MSP4-1]|uniref:PulJ/GspJ family protein n=1 Tax=Virgibacillus sp. MSP4-1 TaxID=2700081 RepID=UPI00137BE818|nr:prepilin-type N-terminal cleavage/methylation domain-containing protein [Virgibacillus sp. MSP4-1]QHS24266.1 prepilin-type N-terminal cleavage/methylation domain-containing protein [Virgibacillus sp. MSP4-1]